MWTKRGNGREITLRDAQSYCANLRFGGYANWNLPTAAQMLGIYDRSANGGIEHLKGGIDTTGGHPWLSDAAPKIFNLISGDVLGGDPERGTFT